MRKVAVVAWDTKCALWLVSAKRRVVRACMRSRPSSTTMSRSSRSSHREQTRGRNWKKGTHSARSTRTMGDELVLFLSGAVQVDHKLRDRWVVERRAVNVTTKRSSFWIQYTNTVQYRRVQVGLSWEADSLPPRSTELANKACCRKVSDPLPRQTAHL